jgi:predicted RecB family nuclease
MKLLHAPPQGIFSRRLFHSGFLYRVVGDDQDITHYRLISCEVIMEKKVKIKLTTAVHSKVFIRHGYDSPAPKNTVMLISEEDAAFLIRDKLAKKVVVGSEAKKQGEKPNAKKSL